MKHHIGNTNHTQQVLVYDSKFSDEYFWEFTSPEEILQTLYGLEVLNNLLAIDIGFEITDTPDPLPRFHHIKIHACIPKDSYTTLVTLSLK